MRTVPTADVQLPVLSVTDATRLVKDCLSLAFPCVAVVGEVSNCTRAGSGHVYFTLKDETAQLRAVVWRSAAVRLKFEIHDGLQVVAVGPIELYQGRGTIQLIVEQLIPQGIGALELAFRQLQERLAAEGLFDPARKRPIPRFPRRIALVTSPTGAAVHDMLQVIAQRWRASDVLLVPVAVQGPTAANEIAAALRMVHCIPGVDVVITGRGGGSLEDLWAFNEEAVARAVYDCRLPVICAVGHEIDVSIADLVADLRALTPTQAAALAAPDGAALHADLDRLRERLTSGLRTRAAQARLQLDALASRPVLARPLEQIAAQRRSLDDLSAQLTRRMERRVEQASQTVERMAHALDALSPLQVLGRGYSVTQRADTGELLSDAAQAAPGDRIITRLNRGRLMSRVEEVEPRTEENTQSLSPPRR